MDGVEGGGVDTLYSNFLIFILSKSFLLSFPGVKRKRFKPKSVLLRYLLPLLSFWV